MTGVDFSHFNLAMRCLASGEGGGGGCWGCIERPSYIHLSPPTPSLSWPFLLPASSFPLLLPPPPPPDIRGLPPLPPLSNLLSTSSTFSSFYGRVPPSASSSPILRATHLYLNPLATPRPPSLATSLLLLNSPTDSHPRPFSFLLSPFLLPPSPSESSVLSLSMPLFASKTLSHRQTNRRHFAVLRNSSFVCLLVQRSREYRYPDRRVQATNK